MPAHLQEVDLQLISQDQCSSVYGHITDNMICTDSPRLAGTCQVRDNVNSPDAITFTLTLFFKVFLKTNLFQSISDKQQQQQRQYLNVTSRIDISWLNIHRLN